MWFDGIRQPDTLYVANTSRGKDSTAMLRAIQIMQWPLDMIVSVDIWATQDIPAELPPMVAFKDEYDRKVLEWFGVPVTRLCATKRERERENCVRLSYSDMFYRELGTGKFAGTIKGFPLTRGSWCKHLKSQEVDLRGYILSQSVAKERERERLAARRPDNLRVPADQRNVVQLKPQAICYGFPISPVGNWCTALKSLPSKAFRGSKVRGAKAGSKEIYSTGFSGLPQNEGRKINIVHYLGIAADEPIRIARHIPKKDSVLPLVQIGWDEDLCGLEAQYMDMLSPTYGSSTRDGCWFCHNQSVGQLRNLRKNYPDLWALLLKWDKDSPVSFKPDGHTVHDFDRRFALEDEGFISADDKVFRWTMLDDELNYRLF